MSHISVQMARILNFLEEPPDRQITAVLHICPNLSGVHVTSSESLTLRYRSLCSPIHAHQMVSSGDSCLNDKMRLTSFITRDGNCVSWSLRISVGKKEKEKERKSIYIAPFCTKVHTKGSGMDHTVLPANNTIPAFSSWRSPNVTTTATDAAAIQLQLTTRLSTQKGWKAEWVGLVGVPIADGLPT